MTGPSEWRVLQEYDPDLTDVSVIPGERTIIVRTGPDGQPVQSFDSVVAGARKQLPLLSEDEIRAILRPHLAGLPLMPGVDLRQGPVRRPPASERITRRDRLVARARLAAVMALVGALGGIVALGVNDALISHGADAYRRVSIPEFDAFAKAVHLTCPTGRGQRSTCTDEPTGRIVVTDVARFQDYTMAVMASGKVAAVVIIADTPAVAESLAKSPFARTLVADNRAGWRVGRYIVEGEDPTLIKDWKRDLLASTLAAEVRRGETASATPAPLDITR